MLRHSFRHTFSVSPVCVHITRNIRFIFLLHVLAAKRFGAVV